MYFIGISFMSFEWALCPATTMTFETWRFGQPTQDIPSRPSLEYHPTRDRPLLADGTIYAPQYEALTIMMLMGHQIQRPQCVTSWHSRKRYVLTKVVHKLATNEIRPPALAAVNYGCYWSGREDLNLRPLGP